MVSIGVEADNDLAGVERFSPRAAAATDIASTFMPEASGGSETRTETVGDDGDDYMFD